MNVFDIDFRPDAAGPRLHETDRQNAGGCAALFRPSPPRSRRSLRSGSHRPTTTGRGRPATTTTKATRPWKRILAAGRVELVTARWANDFATSGSKPSVAGSQTCEPRANRAARRGIAGRRTGKHRVSPVFSTPTEHCVGDRKSAHTSLGWGDSLQPHARGLVLFNPATRMLLGQNAPGNGHSSDDWGLIKASTAVDTISGGGQRRCCSPEDHNDPFHGHLEPSPSPSRRSPPMRSPSPTASSRRRVRTSGRRSRGCGRPSSTTTPPSAGTIRSSSASRPAPIGWWSRRPAASRPPPALRRPAGASRPAR